MKKVIINFGVIYGLALGLGFFVSHLIFGTDPNNFSISEVVGYGIIIISSIAVIFGILDYRNNQNSGQIGFFQGLGIGSAISAIAGLFFGAYNFIYLKWINPDFTETYMEYSRLQIETSGASEAIKEQQLHDLAQYAELMSSDLLQSALMFVTVLLIGFVFSLISAAMLRKSA